jgi:hypothetical protein
MWMGSNISCEIPNGKVVAHMGFKSKILQNLPKWNGCDFAREPHCRVLDVNFDIGGGGLH